MAGDYLQGYTCPNCGGWRNMGMTHICYSYPPPLPQTFMPFWPPAVSPSVEEKLDKMIALLERLEKLLEEKK
jgi:hypothetical protein